MEKRKSGFYWVQMRGVDFVGWQIAEWNEKHNWWFVTGYEDSILDGDMHAINENRIMSPDEWE